MVRTTRFKTAIYTLIAQVAKAAANPVRLEILDLLAQAPHTVEAVARQVEQSVANTSRHLQVLRAARLVDTEKAGQYVTYRLTDALVGGFMLQLRTLAHARLAEIDRVRREYLDDRGALDALGQDDLMRKVRSGEVTVVDVRPGPEFDAGHIPGAVSIPLGELKKRLRELPKHRAIVAFCRGPYCVMAADAVAVLRAKGYRAHAIAHGVPEWRANGWRIETSKGRREGARP
ncbi:MAG: metalloregulator ArsR/SmtB family transcription factor [Acidobacteria bacterium]|nr:metalloregulator ArsR/SmtB family transcription factor [Acidobacteriota bacterium]MSO61516.1 metalloregulator ArsR/SmtB family transcription factor [Acidobacteriota bacterium]